MVCLVRIALDLRNRSARHDLRDAVAVHRRVMSLVADGIGPQARQKAGVLFRLDQTPTGPVMLVQSALPPNIERLPDGYGTAEIRDITPLIEALRPGMAVRYRIAANASKRVAKGTLARKVVPLSGIAADEWWHRKAEAIGLRLLSLRSDQQPPMVGRLKTVRHGIVRFDGHAVICDAELVRSAVLSGVGRGKSFGCGMLSLAPAR